MDYSIGVPINKLADGDEESEFFVQKMTDGALCFRMLSCCKNCYVHTYVTPGDLLSAIKEAVRHPAEREEDE